MTRKELLEKYGHINNIKDVQAIPPDTKILLLTIDPELLSKGDVEVDVEGIKKECNDAFKKAGVNNVEILLLIGLTAQFITE